MEPFETLATVQPQGELVIAGVPFAPGTEVEVVVSRKRAHPADFAETWKRVCAELRRSIGAVPLSQEDIDREVQDYRAGR